MISDADIESKILLYSCLCCFPFDFVARQCIAGSHLNFFILKQLPVLLTKQYDCQISKEEKLSRLIFRRVLELIYTSWDLEAFAKDCGYDGPPFVWNEERRSKIRAELDAAYFHLYLGTEEDWNKTGTKELLEYFPTPRYAVEYIMETFPIVKRKDEAKYEGKYRTKELILETYDKMAESIRTGNAYQSILDPLPGPPCDAQGNFIPMGQWDTANWPMHIHQPKETEIHAVIQPAGKTVEKGKIVLDVLALLYAFEGKRVDRLVLEIGLILMQHESLRKSILSRGIVRPDKTEQSAPPRIQYMDNFLAEFNGSQFTIKDSQFIQTIELGPKSESLEEIKAREIGVQALNCATEAVEVINRIREVSSNKDESFEILGVENVAELIIQGYAA
jgi:hypothetical protein